jgi:hypothetical protein
MKKKIVTIEFEIPDDISDEDFKEWAKFELGWNAGCRCDNPLVEEYCVSELETSFNIRDCEELNYDKAN